MEARAKECLAGQQAEYEGKVKDRQEKQQEGKKPRGREPKPPTQIPGAKEQYNCTDPESRIMKAGSGNHFEQNYNAQTALEVESRLIVGGRVVDEPN